MISKTFKYVDFNGNPQEETFYFHLNKSDIIELEVSDKDGFSEMIKKIIDSGDNRRILQLFKDVIGMSVGEKSEDGQRFVKNDNIRSKFIHSPAYDEFLISLMQDSTDAADFIKAILPADLDISTSEKKVPSDHKKKQVKTDKS